MARRKKMNETFVTLTVPCGVVAGDVDFRILAPGDNTKITHWKVARSRVGVGTAVISMGIFSGALGTGTRVTADVSNDIDAAVGSITSGADATGDATFDDGAPIFIFLNYDAGTVTSECVCTVTLFMIS